MTTKTDAQQSGARVRPAPSLRGTGSRWSSDPLRFVAQRPPCTLLIRSVSSLPLLDHRPSGLVYWRAVACTYVLLLPGLCVLRPQARLTRASSRCSSPRSRFAHARWLLRRSVALRASSLHRPLPLVGLRRRYAPPPAQRFRPGRSVVAALTLRSSSAPPACLSARSARACASPSFVARFARCDAVGRIVRMGVPSLRARSARCAPCRYVSAPLSLRSPSLLREGT